MRSPGSSRKVLRTKSCNENGAFCSCSGGQSRAFFCCTGLNDSQNGKDCHQKAFAAMGAVESTLRLVPGLSVETVDSSCCGMAGAFGYDKDNVEVSKSMGELALLPAVRNADADTVVVADGTSCRHQIADGTPREAIHVAQVLERYLAAQ